MNCPKCGNYVEDGKTYCFMCGTKIGNGDFSSPGRNDENPSLNSEYYRKKEEYKNRLNNYRDVKIERIDNEKRDLFDLYSEYKIFFKLGIFIFIIAITLVIAYNVAVRNNKEVELKPRVGKLYYKVDSKLTTSSENDGAALYTISENVGATCSIGITSTVSTSGNYVKDKFATIQNEYIGSIVYDDNMNTTDNLNIPLFTQDVLSVNGTKWNYLYVFYKENNSDNKFVFLKYRHLSIGYKESFYDITLANNNNDPRCNLYLDSFVRSLKFV